jgi:hypothetical protein
VETSEKKSIQNILMIWELNGTALLTVRKSSLI